MSDAFTVSAPDLKQFGDRAGQAAKLVKPEMRTAMQRSTLMVQREAQRETPVVTGTLRRSITTEASAERGTVGTNVPYAKAVHDGRVEAVPVMKKALRWIAPDGSVVFSMRSKATKGKPFLKDAFERLKPQIRREFEQVPKRIFAKLGGR